MTEKLSPGMIQFYEIKSQYEDCILFFRMGDFYEMFGEDANIAHRVLGITVTSRNKNASIPIPLAGIPFHAKEKYLPLLVQAGYKVAIAEQVSDPKLKGLVKREVLRVVTPATLALEGDGYDSHNEKGNVMLSISEKKGKYGISYLDISTNKWLTGEFESFDSLKGELYKISPKEVILDKKLFSNTDIKDILTKKYSLNIFYYEGSSDAKSLLLDHFGVTNLEGFGINSKPLAILSSALLLEYLQDNQKSQLAFLKSLSFDSFSEYMNIDEATIKSLDLVYNISTHSSTIGTLFGVLNKTKTSAGSRFLRDQILHPLQNIEQITFRQNVIEELIKSPQMLDSIQGHLKQISDIDLIVNRLALNRVVPKDLLNLKKSLEALIAIFEIIEKDGSENLKCIFKPHSE